MSNRVTALVTLSILAVAMPLSPTSGASDRGAVAFRGGVHTAGTDPCRQPGPYPLPQADEPVDLDPAEFTTRIDNPYWPMRVGTVWHYVERGAGRPERVAVTVTHRTRVIEGIRVRVVHDVLRDGTGEIKENTYDWYAQDSGGSIWYFGEFTREYEDGRPVSSEGSFQHGRDGAQAGVVVPARPVAGCDYREEYLADEAEDRASVLSTDQRLRTRFGIRRHLLQTANTSPVEPAALENKFYARGLGPVLELDVSPRLGSAVLVGITHHS